MFLAPVAQSNCAEKNPLNTTNHCDFSTGRKRIEIQCTLVWVRKGEDGAVWKKPDDPKEKERKGREALSDPEVCVASQSSA